MYVPVPPHAQLTGPRVSTRFKSSLTIGWSAAKGVAWFFFFFNDLDEADSLSLTLTFSSRKGMETLKGGGNYGWKSNLEGNTEESQTWMRGHEREQSGEKPSLILGPWDGFGFIPSSTSCLRKASTSCFHRKISWTGFRASLEKSHIFTFTNLELKLSISFSSFWEAFYNL